MTTTHTLIFIAAVLLSQLLFWSAKIPLPFGTKEKIIHTMDLPDDKTFQLADGRYFDVGSHYEIRHLFWLTYTHSEPQIVGYLGNNDAYVPLTATELSAIAQTMNTKPSDMAKVGFMDKIGGKILLGIFMLLALYVGYSLYSTKTVSLKEEERIAF